MASRSRAAGSSAEQASEEQTRDDSQYQESIPGVAIQEAEEREPSEEDETTGQTLGEEQEAVGAGGGPRGDNKVQAVQGIPQSAVLNQVPLTGAQMPGEAFGADGLAEVDVPGYEQKPLAERQREAQERSKAATPDARERERLANQGPVNALVASEERPIASRAPTKIGPDEFIDEATIDKLDRPSLIAVMQQRGYEVNELAGRETIRADFKRQQKERQEEQDGDSDEEATDEEE